MTAETTHCEDAFCEPHGLRVCRWVAGWNFGGPYFVLRWFVSFGMVTEQVCETES